MSRASRLFAVGASAGGVHALQALVSWLPADFPAPLLVVLHIGAHRSLLPELLSARGALKARHVRDRERLAPGQILVAPPDHHLLVDEDGQSVCLTRGPKEHHTRPAVDPLFRSAALARGPDVVGVVLTGALDDGTAGLQAIKACGGTAIVQDPAEAFEPSMPASARRHVEIDHCLPLDGIARLLVALARRRPAVPKRARPERLANEHELTLALGDAMKHLERIGRPSSFVCPDCRGGLWQVDGSDPLRFRCHTGHGFTLRSLQHAQAEATDEAVWTAIRALQEKQLLLEAMVVAHRNDLDEAERERFAALARETRDQAGRLRDLVEDAPDTAG